MKDNPPFNPDAEQAVLGSCLIDAEVIRSLEVLPEDFFVDQNQWVYKAILTAGESCNQITVAHELVKMGKIEESGGVSYLSGLVAGVPTSLHAQYYAEIVKQCAFSRRVISSAGQIEAIGYQNAGPAESSERIREIIKKLAVTISDDSVLTPEDVANDAFNYYSDLKGIPCIPTGIQSFDEKKGGYLQGEYVLLCARTGVGKTTIALQQACHIARTLPVLFFSLEMSKQQVTNKNISYMTGIPEQDIALKRYNNEQRDLILSAVDNLSHLKLYIAEGNRTTDSIRMLIERQLDTVGCGIVFVDYLSRIRELGRDEHLRIGHISKELADMGKEYKIPIVALHQFNREIEHRKGDAKRPQISDLREGGEEDADLIVMPYRVPDNKFRIEYHIPKDRLRGKIGYFEGTYYEGRYL